jgi:hypothetical protein
VQPFSYIAQISRTRAAVSMNNPKLSSLFPVVGVIATCAALAVPGFAYAQATISPSVQPAAVSEYVPASVKAAPDLRCTLHPEGSPSKGITVFTDADGYARFHAARPSAGSPAEKLTLSCVNSAGTAASYPVDLASNDTFVSRPLNLANEPGVDRPALSVDPMSRTPAELAREGYGLRPDPAASPALYAAWLEAAKKPGRMLFAKRPEKHVHNVTTKSSPFWIGSVLQGSAPYVSIISTFVVPTAIPGAFGTASTEASIWPGLGGFGTGSGLIQAGVTIYTTPTTAAYSTWREYCCGDGDSNGYSGAFTPSPGDKILAEAWYCDANGQENINGGFGCSYVYDFRSGAVFSCTTPKGSPSNPPCWSVKALPQCSVSPTAPNCMTMGPAAEFIFENQSPQLTPPTDQFPPFAPSIVANYVAVSATGKVTTISDDAAVTRLVDYPHNPPPVLVTLADGDTVFELGSSPGSDIGSIWRSTGMPCSGASCPGWMRLDANGGSVRIAAGGGNLYQLHDNGQIWKSTGAGCIGQLCAGWQMLDNNADTVAIVAAGNDLFQLHRTGKIWKYTGVPCNGNTCTGWQLLDNNGQTLALAAATGGLYQLHNTGKIWKYTGVPCNGNVCSGWQMLDTNGATVAIVAAGNDLYQLHDTGKIWKYTGVPCNGNTCTGWQMLDNNGQTLALAAATGGLYQLHSSGKVWKYTGTPCNANACPGWQMLDENTAAFEIVADGGSLYQLHNTGKLWRYTGTPCNRDSCPGWQMLDENSMTGRVAAAGGQLYQIHLARKALRRTRTCFECR